MYVQKISEIAGKGEDEVEVYMLSPRNNKFLVIF